LSGWGALFPERRAGLLAAAAVGFTFALALIPDPDRSFGEVWLATGLAVFVVGLACLWRAAPAVARLGAPLVYIALVAVLIDSGGGTRSGLGGLFLLPVIWLAVFGSASELAVGFTAVMVTRAAPVAIVGAPDYPSSGWRTALVLAAVAAIAGVTIQRLVTYARRRTSELAARAAELQALSDRLASQNDRLRELDVIKDDFIALVSHEFRTPLTSINGYLEMVLDDDEGTLTTSQRQFLGTVSRNAERLTELVNDLLFLIQVDAGRLELKLTKADLNDILADAVEAATPAADRKRIALRLETKTEAEAVFDRVRLGQLTDNLIANAIKFTPEDGTITVRTTRAEDAIAVSVTDTGIGIPPEELPRLFERFFRASSATAKAIPGTGLGLAISHAIAEAHKGRLLVESELGVGTTFRLLLPAAVDSELGDEFAELVVTAA